MGLFQRNMHESIQRANDTNTLIYKDPITEFNTKSVIIVAPNEQVIFIRNGVFQEMLGPGRHEVETENIPLFTAIRNKLTGGASTFTCEVYHVNTEEHKLNWGTLAPIQFADYHLDPDEPVLSVIRGAGSFVVRFNNIENEDACKKLFMRVMGDKSQLSARDLEDFFRDTFSQEINSTIARKLEEMSREDSVNSITSYLKDFAEQLKPEFDKMFAEYELVCERFNLAHLIFPDSENSKRNEYLSAASERSRKYRDRMKAAEMSNLPGYDKAVAQELMENITKNPAAGGIAAAGAGMGMGMAAGNAFAQMAASAFGATQQPQQPPIKPFMSSSPDRFGTPNAASDQQAQSDPMAVLSKMKELLDAGLISQQAYDNKVAEILSRM